MRSLNMPNSCRTDSLREDGKLETEDTGDSNDSSPFAHAVPRNLKLPILEDGN